MIFIFIFCVVILNHRTRSTFYNDDFMGYISNYEFDEYVLDIINSPRHGYIMLDLENYVIDSVSELIRQRVIELPLGIMLREYAVIKLRNSKKIRSIAKILQWRLL